jgi:hypothetical protein
VSTEAKLGSGLKPDDKFDSNFTLHCKEDHNNLGVFAYINVHQAPQAYQRAMIYSVPEYVEVYVSQFHSEKVWLNFEFNKTNQNFNNLRFDIEKNDWVTFAIQMSGTKVSISISGSSNDENQQMENIDFLGKISVISG